MSVRIFSFFDFLDAIVECLRKNQSIYIFYIESYFVKKIIQIIDELAKTTYSSIPAFLIHDNGLMLFVEEPSTFKRTLLRKLKARCGHLPGLTTTQVQVKKLPSSIFKLLYTIFLQIRNKKRYLPLSLEDELPSIMDILKKQRHIKVDFNPLEVDLFVNYLGATFESTVWYDEKSGKFFICSKNQSTPLAAELVFDKENPDLRLDKINVILAQKVLEAYFLTPTIQRAVLEFLLYRSGGKYSFFIKLLDYGTKNGIFEWDEHAGWVLSREKTHLISDTHPEEMKISFEQLGNTEKLVFSTLITSGHELYIKDLYTAINEITSKELKDVIKSLQDKKLVVSDAQKIHTTHPTVDEIQIYNFRKNKLKEIHKRLAEILHKRRLSGAKIPAWQVARHFELCGDKRGALKYYTESAEEELKKENYERALDQISRALVNCKPQNKKRELWKMKTDIILEKGDLLAAKRLLKDIEYHNISPPNIDLLVKKAELFILLGKIKFAKQVLRNLVKAKGPSFQKLLIIRAKCKLLQEEITEDDVLMLKRKTFKNSSAEVKRSFLELLGDISLYKGNIPDSIGYYEQSLKIPANQWQSVETELKLCTAYFLNFEFYNAFYLLEKILWQVNELSHLAAKIRLLQGILKLYLVLLPQQSLDKFFRLFFEDIMRTSELNFPLHQYLGLYYLKGQKVEKALPLVEKGLSHLRLSGNLYEYNQTLIHVVVLLTQSGEINLAKKFLSSIDSKSAFINEQKQICETLIKLVNGEEINYQDLERRVLLNGLNTLIFSRLTENTNNPEIKKIQEKMSNKVHEFRTILRELDLLAN